MDHPSSAIELVERSIPLPWLCDIWGCYAGRMSEESRTQRIRDPVHGLIVFRSADPLDQLAWKLLDTPAKGGQFF
jgi:hypothetical protein